MKFFFDSGNPTRLDPLVRTRVLNVSECGVSAVGVTIFGKRLCYRRTNSLFAQETIDHVFFLQSKVDKSYRHQFMVEADFDIYTTDGQVIEVHTCDRSVIEAALAYAPKMDIRSRFRAARRGV